jgi:hypothetical protein
VISPILLYDFTDYVTSLYRFENGCVVLLHQHKDYLIVFLNKRNSVTYQRQYGLTSVGMQLIVVSIGEIGP